MNVKNMISKGAKLLDQKIPGWEKKIDLIKLNLGADKFCILGQLSAGKPHSLLKKLGIEDTDAIVMRYGFMVILEDVEEYNSLWQAEIEKRSTKKSVKTAPTKKPMKAQKKG